MKLLDKIIGFFAPFDCLGCGEEGGLICGSCRGLFPDVPERCYRCRQLSHDCATCPACRKSSRLFSVLVVTDYEGVAKQLIWRLKYGNASSVADLIAGLMSEKLNGAKDSADFIVPVPTTAGRARSRGYDQAVLIARRLSRETGIAFLNGLSRQGKTRQVGASRAVRRRQLASAFRVSHRYGITGASILLVDDVVTTGATLEAAASTLRKAGAANVDAIVFAQP